MACRRLLDDRIRTKIPTTVVMEMIELVLDNNLFEFNGQQYIQQVGTAIGSQFGQNDACTYMGEWVNQLLNKSEYKPFMFLRYVDDIIGFWPHVKEKFNKFVDEPNAIQPNIKVVQSILMKPSTFWIFGCENKYCKPND